MARAQRDSRKGLYHPPHQQVRFGIPRAKQGQAVLKGDELVVIEAMKMNHTISADHDGVVKKIFIKVGNQLDLGENLLTLSENKSK